MEATIPVQVNLHTKIKQSGHGEETHLSSTGTLHYKNDVIYLRYDEELDQSEKVNTTVIIRQNEATIIRSGAVSMRQQFVPGTRKEGTYESAYGPISIATETESMAFHWDQVDQIGSLLLTYQILFEGEKTGDHQLQITLKGEEA